jgi:ABC-type transport system substrate-binding protein
MEEARVTLDVAKRLRNYHEAAQIWHDEAPELFLFQGELIDAARNEVTYQARGDQRIILYDISYR